MAASDDKSADFTVDNYAALKLKHPQMETYSVPDAINIDYISTSELHMALMLFPNCSSELLSVPSFENTDRQVEQANWTEYFQSPIKFCKCDSQRKSTFRTAVVLLWCETSCAEKSRWRNWSYRCRQCFPPVVRNMCRIPCLRITSSKIRKSTSKCRHQKARPKKT